MKKLLIFLVLTLILPTISLAKGKITEVTTEMNKKSGRYFLVEPEEKVQVKISLPVEKTAFILHKIPKQFAKITDVSVPDECTVLSKKEIPFLILCKNITENVDISYSGSFENLKKQITSSGFTAGRYETKSGEKFRFFERIRIKVSPIKKESTTKEKDENKKENGKTKESKDTETMTPGEKKLSEIHKHERTEQDSESKIILDESEDVFVANQKIEPNAEPVIVDKLTVKFEDVDTSALYGDITDDTDVIDSVSLWYQDGTPVLKENGNPAKAFSVDSNGKAIFEDLNMIIPEGGEQLFIAVDIGEMLKDKSGSAFTAHFSPSDADHNINGFWSQSEYSADIFDDSDDPIQYVLANKLTLTQTENQPQTLFPGTNELLKFEAEVIGKDDLFLKQIQVDISKASDGGNGFRVSKLRLKHRGDIIASVSGADLTGLQSLNVGQCAGGDTCNNNAGGNGQEIGGNASFLIEAEITKIGVSFSGNNSLNATIDINGALPGSDGASWIDYGSGENDGVEMQWVDNDSGDRSDNRIQNVISS